NQLRRQGRSLTITPTALVHEAWLRMATASARDWASREHFFNTLALAMRQVILDLAKRNATRKHGGEWVSTTPNPEIPENDFSFEEVLAMQNALDQLRQYDPELAQLAEWRFLAGIPLVEIAALRGVNQRTVKRHWAIARAFLAEVMQVSTSTSKCG